MAAQSAISHCNFLVK